MDAVFGGAEANVAVALARWGVEAAYVTVLPEAHAVADAGVRELRRQGVDVSHIRHRPGRFGLYFMEAGAGVRPARVIYDREESSIAQTGAGEIGWDGILSNARWFHLSGITPALSRLAAEASEEAIRVARASGVRVSLDLNYRQSLWRWGESAAAVLGRLAGKADVLIANEAHLRLVMGEASQDSADYDARRLERLAAGARDRFPNLGALAMTVRVAGAGAGVRFGGCLSGVDGFVSSRIHDIPEVVDRVGAGDSFAAGLIFGLETLGSEAAALELAAGAGCLKHSIPGDFLQASLDEVRIVASGGTGFGRIER